MDESVADGPTIGGKTRAEWEIIRPHYEDTPETVLELCTRFGTNKTALRNASIHYGWRLRRPRRIDRGDLIERLFRLLDSQIRNLENDMNAGGKAEAAELGRMVNSLDRLIVLRKAHTASRHPKRATRDISDIKAKLIERIEQLKRR